MIRTNLSTRPFYNERIISIWLLVLLLIVVVASVFNATRVIQYSRNDTELGLQASSDETRATELRRSAARVRTTVDPKQIAVASLEARQANDLIDRRTFSWTELFNLFETTLPDEVRITAVRPKIDKGQFLLTIFIIARSVEDISQLMDRLERTGAFASVGKAIEERVNEQGQIQASLEAVYIPAAGRAAGRGTAARGGRR
jgi:Tfp pilus assembly protein PilN